MILVEPLIKPKLTIKKGFRQQTYTVAVAQKI